MMDSFSVLFSLSLLSVDRIGLDVPGNRRIVEHDSALIRCNLLIIETDRIAIVRAAPRKRQKVRGKRQKSDCVPLVWACLIAYNYN